MNFQARVQGWMQTCFGPIISADKVERNDRFIEEALELVQSLGYERQRAHALVDYVFDRPIGEPSQETGGVMVTLAALCEPNGLDMERAAETELSRILAPEIVAKIRAKQASKPTGSALPVVAPWTPSPAAKDVLAERRRQVEGEGWSAEHDDKHDRAEMARAAASYVLQYVSSRTYFALSGSVRSVISWLWPWDAEWFKPDGGRRDLVKGAALLIAELEYIDRLEMREESRD